MEKYKLDDRNGLWYELQGDYYLPCLKLPEEEQAYIGIWGQRHLRYTVFSLNREYSCSQRWHPEYNRYLST